jgi:hypothetical protein
MVGSFVGASIFVNDPGSMLQGQHGRDADTILPSQSDLQILPHTLDQIAKPAARLWDQPLTPSRHSHQAVEFRL